MEVGDVGAKLSSFGWDVMEIDGHSMEKYLRQFNGLRQRPILQPRS